MINFFKGVFEETINFFKRLFLRTCNFLRIRIDLIEVVFLRGLGMQLCGKVLFDVKHVLLVVIREVFVHRVLCNVELVGEKRAHTAKLQNALAAVQHRQQLLPGAASIRQL